MLNLLFIQGKSVSVIEHYCKLASKDVPIDLDDLTKRKDIQYFYITVSENKKQKSYDEYVNILDEKNFLISLNAWDKIKYFFSKQ